MQFYLLDHPNYTTWEDYKAANPVRMIDSHWLPGIACSVCGATWAGGRRLYLPLTEPALQRRLSDKPLPGAKWRRLAQEVRASLGLPNDFYLEPGDVLGMPVAELLAPEVPDFMSPFPGQLIVKEQVVLALQDAQLTGVRPIRIELTWGNQVIRSPSEAPALFELMVTGTALRVGTETARNIVCQHCGRRTFPDPDWMVVNESSWDCSDFFLVDCYPTRVIVTEKVCQVLAQHGFSNYACNPLPSQLMLPKGRG